MGDQLQSIIMIGQTQLGLPYFSGNPGYLVVGGRHVLPSSTVDKQTSMATS